MDLDDQHEFARDGELPAQAKTLWHGRFTGGPSESLVAYTVSLPYDQRMWRDDIVGSRAHVRGLERVSYAPKVGAAGWRCRRRAPQGRGIDGDLPAQGHPVRGCGAGVASVRRRWRLQPVEPGAVQAEMLQQRLRQPLLLRAAASGPGGSRLCRRQLQQGLGQQARVALQVLPGAVGQRARRAAAQGQRPPPGLRQRAPGQVVQQVQEQFEGVGKPHGGGRSGHGLARHHVRCTGQRVRPGLVGPCAPGLAAGAWAGAFMHVQFAHQHDGVVRQAMVLRLQLRQPAGGQPAQRRVVGGPAGAGAQVQHFGVHGPCRMRRPVKGGRAGAARPCVPGIRTRWQPTTALGSWRRLDDG